MRRAGIYLTVFLVFLLSSCGRKEKVIPRDKMAKIYAEMFIADQKINLDRDARKMADTSFVYEPIFEKYGYTVEDYRASMAHYIKDPDRYARILRNSASMIETEIKTLKKERERLEALEKLQDEVSEFIPERIFRLTGLGNPDIFAEDSLHFYVDSTGGELYFDVRDWMDTAFFGPVMKLHEADTVSVSDTAAVAEAISEIMPGEVDKPVSQKPQLKPVREALPDSARLPVRGTIQDDMRVRKDKVVEFKETEIDKK